MVEDKYLVKCSWVSNIYEENCFLKKFTDKGWSFGGLKTLLEKMTTVESLIHFWVVVDHTSFIALIGEVKDLELIFINDVPNIYSARIADQTVYSYSAEYYRKNVTECI